jgi:transcriptional regulator GlxA family with amidase domain
MTACIANLTGYSVKFDTKRANIDMFDIAIIDRAGPLRSSLALSHDVLWTANAISAARGKPEPFAIRYLAQAGHDPAVPAALIVPGHGLAGDDAVAADLELATQAGWPSFLRKNHEGGSLLVSSCSGVFLLGAAGLLDDRTCTTSWFLAPMLARRFPKARVKPDAILVEDGTIITGGAAMAQGEAMIALVARLAGFDLADLTARYLLLDNKRSQADYRLIAPMVAGDPMLAEAERWTRTNIREPFTISDLAGVLGTTPRTLARRLAARCGMSPVRFVNHIRREEAHALLSAGARFDQTAFAVGYSDASALRRLLAKTGQAIM